MKKKKPIYRRGERRTRHGHAKVARGAVALLGVLALAEPALEAEDDGGPVEFCRQRVGHVDGTWWMWWMWWSGGRAHVGRYPGARVAREGSAGPGWAVVSGRAYHPMYLLRMKMAAMGRVEERVDWNSTASPFGGGSW